MSFFDDFLKSTEAKRDKPIVDTKLAFDVWSEKQSFYKKLPENKAAKLTISAEQLLLLMKHSYTAGFTRASS